MDMDRYIGRLLDNRYEILEVIGSGGMSVVYKARCHRLNRLVAVKILKDENLQDEDFRRRFHAESQAVAMLSHPNIVSVYDVSTDKDADYIVMELIDGITLKQYMEKKGVLNWKETLHFGMQIAKALEHAHSRGLVHRDIKPHNVMVLKNGSVKVADFGIAQIMSQSNTLTTEALGSVHYISPEQAKGGRVDARSDIYSLGVVMYEMITGRPPYDGESPVSVAIQHINGGASRPSTLNPNIPKGLEQIIIKSMARDLRRRYPSATAMLYDMDEFRKDPDMVFSMEPVKTDPTAATRIVSGTAQAQKEQGKPQTLAEKAPQSAAAINTHAPQPNKVRDREKAETSRSSVATIAIVVCAVVAMAALVIFTVILIDHSTSTDPSNPVSVRIPKVEGMLVENLPHYNGIEVVVQNEEYSTDYEAGRIIRQDPEAGVNRPSGAKIYVVVSLGPAPKPQVMPAVAGMTRADVEELLQELVESLNLSIQWKETYSTTVPAGSVIKTDPDANAKLKEGQTLTITISKGKNVVKAEMPNLLRNGGYDWQSAKGMMDRRGFTNVEFVEVDSLVEAGRVVSQSIEAGEEVDVTTHIIIEYSSGKVPAPVIPVNYEELEQWIETALSYDMKAYTKLSWDAMEAVLVQAQALVPGGSQVQVDAAVLALQEACEGLVKMDYTGLLAVIEAAQQLIQEEYTQESWDTLVFALGNASSLLENRDQTLVDAGQKELEMAIAALQPVGSGEEA